MRKADIALPSSQLNKPKGQVIPASKAIARCLVFSLSATLFTGCSLLQDLYQNLPQQASDQTPGDTSQSPQTDSPASAQSNTPAFPATGQNFSCETRDHFAEVIWRNRQARMSFATKPNAPMLNAAPVSVAGYADGRRVYTFRGETTTTATTYPNGDCDLRVAAGANTTVQERGRIALAVREPSPEPNQDNLSLTCTGTIDKKVDVTVYYTQEAGFSRVEFRPRSSNAVLPVTLSYSEKDDLGQDIWRGKVNGTTDAVVIHLSPNAPRRGDQLSVKYDIRWGRAACQ